MKVFTQVFLLLAVSILSTCDKNNDESRPYEFGFTIDGQQHRHEKKDDKGIIQGEFGFITADGIYHVTVYATDENGNFKILSMKNLRISAPLDGSPQTGPLSPEAGKYLNKVPQAAQQPQKPAPQPEPLSIPEQPVQPQLQPQPQQPVTTQKPKVNYPFTTQPTIKPACAGCGYVTTPKPIPGQPFPFQNSIFKQQDSQNQAGQQSTGSQFQGGAQGQNGPQGQQNGQQDVDYQSQQGGQFNFQNTKTETIETSKQQTIQGQGFIGSQGQGGQTGPVGGGQGGGQFGGQSGGQIGGQGGQFGGQSGGAGGQVNGQGGQFGGQPGQVQAGGPPNPNPLGIDIPAGSPGPLAQNGQNYTPFPPVAVQDNVINVGGKTPQQIPIRDKFPGMQDGLPEGIEEKDIKDLLYKFHYTVGFHGHYEKGLKNGAKIGGYFVNGRDGISRVVTYVADENGYRAKTKLINLGLDSDETPKEATEKTFGLKSFEFVWYPIE